MPLHQSGLLELYLKATRSNSRLTFGKTSGWNKKSQNVVFHPRPYIINMLITFVFGLPIIFSIGKYPEQHNLENEDGPPRDQLVNMQVLAFMGHLVSFLFPYHACQHLGNMKFFWNQVLNMEKRYWKPDDTVHAARKLTLAKFLSQLFIIGIVLTGLGLGIVGTVIPTLPMNIFSYPPGSYLIRSECWSGTARRILQNIVEFTGNVILFSLAGKRALVATIELMIGSVCLTLLLSLLKRKMARIQYTSNKIDSTDELSQVNLLYRQIQIISMAFSKFASGQLVILFIAFGLGQICTLLELINSTNRNYSSLSGYTLDVVLALCLPEIVMGLNFIYGFCGDVYESSVQILNQAKYRATGLEPKIYKKLLRSYRPVRKNTIHTEIRL